MTIKTNKELSFGRLIDQKLSKEEICKLKNLTSEAYDKAHISLIKIREAKRKATESQKVKVTIEGRKGLYYIDMECREFKNTENPDDKVSFDIDIKITSVTCQHCGEFIDRLNYNKSGTYDIKKDSYIPKNTEFSCQFCHALFDKNILIIAMGATA